MHDSKDCSSTATNLPNSTPEKTLTCREAASFIAASARTLEGWRRKGQGPAYIRQGRSIRYRLTDLIQFQQANKIEPGAK